MANWTDIFMMNDAPCKTVDRYADYKENEEQAYCYLRKVPMYYFQPLNVEAMDRSIFVSGWVNWEVELAKKARICGVFGCTH